MSLIIILLALLLERVAVFIRPIREHRWFEHYSQKINKVARGNAYLSLSLSVVSVLVIVFLLHEVLSQFSFGWVGWIFDLMVLFYCLGNTHLRVQIRECYEQIELGNTESARALLLENFGLVETGEITPHVLLKAFYHVSLQHVFSVLFWFVVLGPVGAVLYRMVQKLSVYHIEEVTKKVQLLADRVLFVLDWVPARLLALGFCLAGHFTDIFAEWRKTFKTGIKEAYQVLYSCGYVAVRTHAHSETVLVLTQFDEAYYLVCRALFIWLVVLALIILF